MKGPPPLLSKTVDLGPRPNTVEASSFEVVEISSAQIEAMDNHALATWLTYKTSMWIDPSLPRSKFLTEFMRIAYDVQ